MLPFLTLIRAKGRLRRVGSEWGLECAVQALEQRVEEETEDRSGLLRETMVKKGYFKMGQFCTLMEIVQERRVDWYCTRCCPRADRRRHALEKEEGLSTEAKWRAGP